MQDALRRAAFPREPIGAGERKGELIRGLCAAAVRREPEVAPMLIDELDAAHR